MSTEDVVSFSLRGLPVPLDKTISAIAMMEGKSKNQLIIDLLAREFSNPIATYARKSALVQAMDKEICETFNCKLLSNWYENEHIIYAEKKYSQLLGLKTEQDIDVLFKKSIPLINTRAKQVIVGSGFKTLPLGISLTFALFIKVASMDKPVIESVKNGIFSVKQEKYELHINEIRKELGLEII